MFGLYTRLPKLCISTKYCEANEIENDLKDALRRGIYMERQIDLVNLYTFIRWGLALIKTI